MAELAFVLCVLPWLGTYPLRRMSYPLHSLSTWRWRERLGRHYRNRPVGGWANEAIRPVTLARARSRLRKAGGATIVRGRWRQDSQGPRGNDGGQMPLHWRPPRVRLRRTRCARNRTRRVRRPPHSCVDEWRRRKESACGGDVRQPKRVLERARPVPGGR